MRITNVETYTIAAIRIETYLYDGAPCVKVWRGRQSTPYADCRFPNPTQRGEWINNEVQQEQRREADRARWQQEEAERLAQAYTAADLERFAPAIAAARELWAQRCREDYAANGDRGTCVVGAGIFVDFRQPRGRRACRHMIIEARDVAACQGSLNWEIPCREIISFLATRGIIAHYSPGRMD